MNIKNAGTVSIWSAQPIVGADRKYSVSKFEDHERRDGRPVKRANPPAGKPDGFWN
jgi:hypothetical protein